jgi:hypothetical protein
MQEAIEFIGWVAVFGVFVLALITRDSPESRSWVRGSLVPWASDAADRDARASRLHADALVREAIHARDGLVAVEKDETQAD